MMRFIKKGGGVAAAVGLALSPTVQAGSFNITSGTNTTQQTLNAGETGQVQSGATLQQTGNGNIPVTFSNTGGSTLETLTNLGTITQTNTNTNGNSRALRNTANGANIQVTNGSATNSTAIIKTANADVFQVSSNSNVTLDNYGIIQSLNNSAGTANGGNQGINWKNATGTNTLHNYGTGQILANGADAVRPGINGSITNDAGGTIKATPVVDTTISATQVTGSDGIDAQTNTGVTVTNAGTIEGRHGITGGNGVTAFTMSITNNAGGTLNGVNGSGINIDGAGGNVTVVNNGTITGHWDNTKYTIGDGDAVDVDGRINLTNNGIIRGGSSSLGNISQGVTVGGGTITNNAGAEISANNVSGNGVESEGIRVDNSSGGNAFAAVSITNSGTIRGYQGSAIDITSTFDNTITNNAGGTIRGASIHGALDLVESAGNDTVINRGALIGDNGQAIDLGGGNNTLTIAGGAASIQGNVNGGVGGSNTLNFNIGTGNSFSYSGVLSNFANVQVNGGTTTLSGANTYSGPTTVNSGTLLATNTTGSATGSGAVEVKSGAILGGSGLITGPVTLDLGGILSPGVGGIGALGVGNTVLSAGSNFAIDLDPTHSTNDLLNVTGSVSLNLSNLVITLLSAPNIGQTFDILKNDGTDAVSGLFSQGDAVFANYGGRSYFFRINYAFNADGGVLGNDIRLTAVPEPSSGFLFGLGGLMLALKRRFAKA